MMALWLALLALFIAAQSRDADPLLLAQNQIHARDFESARATLETAIDESPDAYRAHYGLACVYAQLGRPADACESLLDAITYGFTDFHEMRREPLLAPIHSESVYMTIVAGWEELLDARAESEADALRRAYGKAYRVERDENLRLSYVWAQRPEAFAMAQSDIEFTHRWAVENVFGDTLAIGGEAPDPWVTVVLPTPEDFAMTVAVSNVGGFYDHDRKRLIAQDLGPTLRHEFLHVLHWRVLSRTSSRHPDWLMEAIGALIEDIVLLEDGSLTPTISWRTNIAKRRLRMGRLMAWSDLFSLPEERFRGVGAGAPYAQARAIALFLYERGVLRAWFETYVSQSPADPTGAGAFEAVFSRPIAEVEADFRSWLADLEWAPEEPEIGGPWFAADLTAGRGDGPRILAIPAGSPVRRAGLRMGDVLVRIGGRRVWTPEDVHRVIGSLEIGQTTEVEVRRGSREFATEVSIGEFAG